MTPTEPKRILTGLAYLEFLREYCKIFPLTRVREKILGPFLL